MMDMLVLDNISKTFNPGTVNEKKALEHVSLALAAGDFAPEHRAELEGLEEALCPAVRNAALAEEFWELAGDDQYDGAGELALVGQMVDEARADVGETRVEIELYIRF